MKKHTSKVVDLMPLIRQAKQKAEPVVDPVDPEDYEDAIDLGLSIFEDHLDDAKGFLTITFDHNGLPSVLQAGDVEPFEILDVLEFIKSEVLKDEKLLKSLDEFFDELDSE